MKKPLQDLGHAVDCARPFRLPSYVPGREPDPAQCTGCLIIVNDPGDGPRLRLAVSNGASWDILARVEEVRQTPTTVDLSPIVRQAVAEALPALASPQSHPQLLPALAPVAQALARPVNMESGLEARVAELEAQNRLLAQSVLDIAEQFRELAARVHYIEHNAAAVDTLKIKEAAA